MNVEQLERIFIYDDIKLPDPNRELSLHQVVELYSNTYPEMATAVAVEKDINLDKNQIEYEISSNLGTKG